MTDRRALEAGSQPPLLYPPYKSTVRRAPAQPLVQVPERLVDSGGAGVRLPADRRARQRPHPTAPRRAARRTHHRRGPGIKQDGRAVPYTLVELWQCNAAGRYRHGRDHHPAPIDPNFSGGGRTVTDAQGNYRFLTIKPGAYPWGNHDNAWRPAHIHFSLFGHSIATRLVTQMYFPNDPLCAYDPMYSRLPTSARACASCRSSTSRYTTGLGIGISLRYRAPRHALDSVRRTRMSDPESRIVASASQTVGPFFHVGPART